MIWDSVWCSWWRSTDRRRTLARKLARPDAFESLPRLVVALRGVQQVNDRVDLLEVEPDRSTAEVDSLLKQLDNFYGKGERRRTAF